MKIKKNEIAIFELIYLNCDYPGSIHVGEKIYFFSGCNDLKKLRRNSVNLSFWDGNNWKNEKIRFDSIISYSEFSDFDASPHPQYSFMRTLNTGLILSCSNMSGHLTPYWTDADENYV